MFVLTEHLKTGVYKKADGDLLKKIWAGGQNEYFSRKRGKIGKKRT